MIVDNVGLPKALLEAIRNDDYDRGECDISVTQLIAPPQIRYLKNKYKGKITEEASDCIWRLMGQAVHTILERANSTDIREERLYTDILGWRVSGKFDNLALENGHLSDYKITSTYAVKSPKPDWEEQLNCLAYLCKQNGYEVKELSITAILRDWNRFGRYKQKDYPKHNVAVIPISLWPTEKTVMYIEFKIAAHQMADNGHVLKCSDEDRWHKPDEWALMAKGKSRAIKLFKSEEQANQITLTKGQYIEFRPGEDKRCEGNYCGVASVCPQWAQIKEAKSEQLS